ncbi:MAG: agmatinase family protein [Bdellovibrionota bacterium]
MGKKTPKKNQKKDLKKKTKKIKPAELQIFGLETAKQDAQLVLIPVPWEVTASYGSGTSSGPELIFEASSQVDLYDIEVKNAYECGYYMLPVPQKMKKQNIALRKEALKVNKTLQNLQKLNTAQTKIQNKINKANDEMIEYVYTNTKEILKSGKAFGIIGGDHSVPYGAIKALSEHTNGNFGILHIDAHLDLRDAYLGYQHSHASIMNNVAKLPLAPKKIIQFGIRDFCEDEVNFMKDHSGKFLTYYDLPTKQQLLNGTSWLKICKEAISQLPDQIYISFDIDGMDPTLCPNTGTPVPGGLSYEQTLALFSTIHEMGKKIVGFDLVEVSGGTDDSNPNYEWNGNVGARMLYKLCGWAMVTQGRYSV